MKIKFRVLLFEIKASQLALPLRDVVVTSGLSVTPHHHLLLPTQTVVL